METTNLGMTYLLYTNLLALKTRHFESLWYTLVAVLIYKRVQVRDGRSRQGQEDKGAGGGRLQLYTIICITDVVFFFSFFKFYL